MVFFIVTAIIVIAVIIINDYYPHFNYYLFRFFQIVFSVFDGHDDGECGSLWLSSQCKNGWQLTIISFIKN